MREIDWVALEKQLGHVIWVSGSPGGGKSTLSKIIASRLELPIYDGDGEAWNHVRLAEARTSPTLYRVKERGLTWILDSPRPAMTRAWYRGGAEDLPFALEDLMRMPTDRAIVADLFNCYPPWGHRLAAIGPMVHLVPSDAYTRHVWSDRKESWREMFAQCRDPDASWERLVVHSIVTNGYVRRTCLRFHLPVVETGGYQSIEESTEKALAIIAAGR